MGNPRIRDSGPVKDKRREKNRLRGYLDWGQLAVPLRSMMGKALREERHLRVHKSKTMSKT